MSEPDIAIDSPQALRAWLEANHECDDGVWLLLWKKDSGEPAVGWSEVADECLCVGWIDGPPGEVDGRRWKLRVAPRDPTSVWSAASKRKVRRLERAGRMTEAGRALVEAAKANGTWTSPDKVEPSETPPDLASALDATDGARDRYERFPDLSKRRILEWIENSRQAATRRKRVHETAEKAALNRMVNHPPGRDAGPPPARD